MKMNLRHISIISGFLLFIYSASAQERVRPQWPEITRETKPWTRWWWMGSAVNKQDLSRLLEQYQEAGLGGVEITSIYGVKGYEDQFIDFLSPQWMEMLTYTLKESKRLGMGVDMAQASGWPFGGSWVGPENACKYVTYKTWILREGERLGEPVQFMQKPLVRTVGEKIDISELQEPIATNPDLQLHAFDQVRFPKLLPLQALMAYSETGKTLDLTNKVGNNGKLNWTAPEGKWELYAVFEGWHGKMVERAGPGGEGNVIDHFSAQATEDYLEYFDKAFEGYDIGSLRAFFNDSYEVDDAYGEANWTPKMFEAFQKRRGYDLRDHLPALFGKDSEENNRRVLCDYRETISDLLLDHYTKEWDAWAEKHDALIRNQAHGSPANILDLYAATDIPEIEGTDIQRIKFASSAAHVTGKALTSSESATWENEHFLSALRDVKKVMDRFFLGGVNHTFYHGTSYSPKEAAWPGWLFYAAVHFNPNNSFWPDFSKLNNYVARCQSFLQSGKPNNDILLYLPIFDAYSTPGRSLLQHFDGIDKGFKGTGLETSAEELLEKGYSYDFISDRQLLNVEGKGNALTTGGVTYKTIVIPDARLIPLETFQKLLQLAKGGATILAYNRLPTDVPGLGRLEQRQRKFKALMDELNFSEMDKAGMKKAMIGEGAVIVSSDLDQALSAAGIKRERMVDQGLEYIRRKKDDGYYYFVVNWSDEAIATWIPLTVNAEAVALFDAMKGKSGYAPVQQSQTGGSEVYVQLAPGASCILETFDTAVKGAPYLYSKAIGKAQEVKGNWTIHFIKGGPELPSDIKTKNLQSWTVLGGENVKNFSGTAKYTVSFRKPKGEAEAWVLDLGQVEESASVVLNGIALGSRIGPHYKLTIPDSLFKRRNVLEVNVSNAMANRIAYMDRNEIYWKKFYNVNVAALLTENRTEEGLFSAAEWKPRKSGLLGPVTLTPVNLVSGAQ